MKKKQDNKPSSDESNAGISNSFGTNKGTITVHIHKDESQNNNISNNGKSPNKKEKIIIIFSTVATVVIAALTFLFGSGVLNMSYKPKDSSTGIKSIENSLLYGIVNDASTGDPVHSATVTLLPGGKAQTTGADGHFQFINIDTSEYTILVQKAGYKPERKKGMIAANGKAQVDVHLILDIPLPHKDPKTQPVIRAIEDNKAQTDEKVITPVETPIPHAIYGEGHATNADSVSAWRKARTRAIDSIKDKLYENERTLVERYIKIDSAKCTFPVKTSDGWQTKVVVYVYNTDLN